MSIYLRTLCVFNKLGRKLTAYITFTVYKQNKPKWLFDSLESLATYDNGFQYQLVISTNNFLWFDMAKGACSSSKVITSINCMQRKVLFHALNDNVQHGCNRFANRTMKSSSWLACDCYILNARLYSLNWINGNFGGKMV